MPFGISLPELLILLVVLLLVFGARRLPEMGRSLGKGMREFKDAVTGVEESVKSEPAELPPASPSNSTTHREESVEEAERERVS